MAAEVDLFIVGGGINGIAIAYDAVGRGLSVVLCEQGDLAGSTSSNSTKLIHGGLRYLESYEFYLVRKALHERSILMRKAPFLIKPLEFILPYNNRLRPAWILRCGLWLYDFLSASDSIPKSSSVMLNDYGDALLSKYKRGFSYYDCQADDSRLVVLTAMAARDMGADIRCHTSCVSAVRDDESWSICLQDNIKNTSHNLNAKAIINAAGPYVNVVSEKIISPFRNLEVSLVKGSHIVVPRCYEHDHAYIFQASDDRVIFAMPYHEKYTLIGTTDVIYHGDLQDVNISDDEIKYLCAEVNYYFKMALSKDDIVWTYSGVRTLLPAGGSASKLSRDYCLLQDDQDGSLPVIHVVGGKITTHRVLASDVMDKLLPYFPKMKDEWTSRSYLPGGDLHGLSIKDSYDLYVSKYSWLPDSLLKRYWESYGTQIDCFLGDCTDISCLGECFGAGLYAVEVDYLISYEWALSCDDILWRRSKLGLWQEQIDTERLALYVQQQSDTAQ